MPKINEIDRLYIAAKNKETEKKFWLNAFGEGFTKSFIHNDAIINGLEYSCDTISYQISDELYEELMSVSKGTPQNLFVILLSSFVILYNKISGNPKCTIATTIFQHKNPDDLLNTIVPVVVDLKNNSMYKEVLNLTKDTVAESIKNQNYPVEVLCEELDLNAENGFFPLTDIGFIVENIHNKSYFKDYIFNLLFSFHLSDNKLACNLQFNTNVYSKTYIKNLLKYFEAITLQSLNSPGIRLESINYLPETELKNIYNELNKKANSDYPQNRAIGDIFDQIVKESPNSIALVEGDLSISYKMLFEKADSYLHKLIDLGVRSNSVVGIMCERSINTIAAILGILKIGASYLPVNPKLPKRRIEFILKDSNCQVICIQSQHETKIENKILTLDLNDPTICKGKINSNQKVSVNQNNCAYIIYTSGTTGKPKGVLIDHKNVIRLLFNRDFPFKFDNKDIWTLFHSINFDFSVWEIFGALLYGSKLVIVPNDNVRDPYKFLKLIRQQQITVLNQTPSSFYNIQSSEGKLSGQLSSIRYIVFGGEALNAYKLKEWSEKYPNMKLINMYGITETTVHVTFKELNSTDINNKNSNIGRPLPTLGVFLCDENMNLLPEGMRGEICVSGEGVSSGYLNNVELTNERFLKKSGFTNNVIYKSGDIGVLSENGELIYHGRNDNQVKIRGFRIELTEIEKVIYGYKKINEAIVIPFNRKNHVVLATYYVSGEKNLQNELREYLQNYLPDYMIPSYFSQVSHFPLTTNGKIDIDFLQKQTAVDSVKKRLPRNDQEKKLVQIWKEVLDVEQLGIDDSFFNIGGDSIRAIVLLSKINSAFNSSIDIATLYSNESIEDLSKKIFKRTAETKLDNKIESELNALKNEIINTLDNSEEIEDIYPMSDIEFGMVYYGSQFPEKAIYHDQIVLQTEFVDFDHNWFKKALIIMSNRHEMLRAAFNHVDYNKPVHIIYKKIEVDYEHYDIIGMSSEDQKDYIKNVLKEDKKRLFDISKAGLWRVKTFLVNKDHIVYALICHHAIMDGWSDASFNTELHNIYLSQEKSSEISLMPLKSGYRDFIKEQMKAKVDNKILGFWEEEMANYERLELGNPNPKQLVEIESYYHDLGIPFKRKLDDFARENGFLTKNVCLGAFAYSLYMFSYNYDLTFGLLVNNRPVLEDADKIIGCFLNSIPFRVKIDEKITSIDYVRHINEKANSLKKYESLSLFEINEKVNDNSKEINPIFDIIFGYLDFHVYSNLNRKNEATGSSPEKLDIKGEVKTNTSLNFGIDATLNKFRILINYNKFDIELEKIDKICQYFISILNKLIDEPQSDLNKSEFLLINDKLILDKLNSNNETNIPNHTILEEIKHQCLKNPNKIAVEDNSCFISYRELAVKIDQLSYYLSEKGVEKNTIVAIIMNPSLDSIVSLFAVLKLGGVYLPINPDQPSQRIQTILNDANCKTILSHKRSINHISYLDLINNTSNEYRIITTSPREQIQDLNNHPIPDRLLIDYEKYNKYIGQAMVKNCMSIQATRGCPYNCSYCHKIWPKAHKYRNAAHIFDEVKSFYDAGVKRFAFIDDIFNLNKRNSTEFFELVLKNNLDIQILFPNGLRGDILTPDYIDLMVEAGTISFALALETASPRIQKLISKNLNIEKLHHTLTYICDKHPQVILELFSMHGFPSETEEEALQTLNFIMDIKWIHFAYIHILKIYPNTEMEELAIQNGVSKSVIEGSINLAHHELPDTSPFTKSFTRQYQTRYFSDYFLSKERLLKVLPYQMKVLTEQELIMKYNSYLPNKVNNFNELINFLGLSKDLIGIDKCVSDDKYNVPNLNQKLKKQTQISTSSDENSYKVLLIDLSQSFTSEDNRLNNMVEPPLGLQYLLTYLKHKFQSKVSGKIIKSMIDFNKQSELKEILQSYKPDLIGVRTLTYYRDFFHNTIANIRDSGFNGPIVAGGPYGTSSYKEILKDSNIDLIVIGEGEVTFYELVKAIMNKNGKLPTADTLNKIRGLAYNYHTINNRVTKRNGNKVIFLDEQREEIFSANYTPVNKSITGKDPAYIIYTSGSTGLPKGVVVEHQGLMNYCRWAVKEYFREESATFPLFSSLSFDLTVTSIYPPLITGNKVVVYSGDVKQILKNIIEEDKVSVIKLTPSHLRLMKELLKNQNLSNVHLKRFIVGGEELKYSLANDIYKLFNKKVEIYNEYGPTETVVGSMIYKFNPETDSKYDSIPIGRPIDNTQIVLIDSLEQRASYKSKGEIIIGGSGVAQGYLNRVELTNESFVKLNNDSEERSYKTGDFGVFINEYNLTYVGRYDNQVKINGYRVELGEIADKVLEYDDVKEAIVINHSENDLVSIYAYVVGTADIQINDLKQFLINMLPEYMVPSSFFLIDEIPITKNGKLDINKLKLLTAKSSFNYKVSDGEAFVVTLFSEVLSLDKGEIQATSNFFELGGNSLNSVILINKVHKLTNVKIPLFQLFDKPTVKDISEYIQSSKKVVYSNIKLAEKREYYNLSPAQVRLYTTYRANSQSTNYNIPIILTIEGKFDLVHLEKTVNQLIKHHAGFRTSFHLINHKMVQQIHPDIKIKLSTYELNGVGVDEIVKRFISPFNLETPPLLRVGVIKISEVEYILMIDLHHIISDGVSHQILVRDFVYLYNGDLLQPLQIQYIDYAEYQNQPKIKISIDQQKDYWLKQLSNHETLNLPTDFERSQVHNNSGKFIIFSIDKEQYKKILYVNKQEGTTIFMFVLACINILLSKLSGQEDIIVGTPVAGRRHSDCEPIIGLFLNTLALRNFPEGELSFREFLDEIRQRCIDAFDNQDYGFDLLVDNLQLERIQNRNPLFDAMLVVQNMELNVQEEMGLSLNNLKLAPYKYQNETSKFDLKFTVKEKDDTLYFNLNYNDQLYKEQTIESYVSFLKNIIESVSENIHFKISDINILSHQENNLYIDSIYCDLENE